MPEANGETQGMLRNLKKAAQLPRVLLLEEDGSAAAGFVAAGWGWVGASEDSANGSSSIRTFLSGLKTWRFFRSSL
jgi:hypothetical protein